ncbi:MAG TPA: hypothetical protein VF092_29290 [Longimicrobium sp.]
MRSVLRVVPVFLIISATIGCGREGDGAREEVDSTTVAAGDTSAAAAPAPARLDLVGDQLDPNGFMINPRWAMQDGSGALPNVETECGGFTKTDPADPHFMNGCTTHRKGIGFVRRASFNVPVPGGNATVCKADPDHVNWRVGERGLAGSATVGVGSIYVDDVASDGDLDLFLRTPGNPGRTSSDPFPINTAGVAVTTGGTAGLEVEILLREVADKFETDFWSDLMRAVGLAGGGKNLAAARELMNGRTAVVTGVFGVDGVHGAHSEIHPVFAMAVRSVPERMHDTWSVFARARGSEGMCSDTLQRLTLPANRLLLWVPWRQGATSARLRFVQHRQVVWRDSIGGPPIAVPITFGSGVRAFAEGELKIDWFGPVVDDRRRDDRSLRWKRKRVGDEQVVEAARERTRT